MQLISRRSPSLGWYKLNIDDAHKPIMGLWLAWWNGQRRVIIELDNIDVVNVLISSAKVGEHNLGQEAHMYMKKE
ncbi:hypothetical protein PVK06_003618 [Gossypium arboreum]|uniref:RNase H type-1 domain-containing protein n=1 Tax=Gossypium arboreum TaxID=29729 RepID=A0ABR0R882_GOSAR|nr:hypothetical protein PVK06_003618 [Gossypium arboreum]